MSKDGAGGLIGLYMGLCILLGDLNYIQGLIEKSHCRSGGPGHGRAGAGCTTAPGRCLQIDPQDEKLQKLVRNLRRRLEESR